MSKKLAIINGCFDILHEGHIKLFEKANQVAPDNVVVFLNSDESYKELKGKKPIMNEDARMAIIQAIKGVRKVIIFNSEKELGQLTKAYAPDYMIKGMEYRYTEYIGRNYVKESILIAPVGTISSSNIKYDCYTQINDFGLIKS